MKYDESDYIRRPDGRVALVSLWDLGHRNQLQSVKEDAAEAENCGAGADHYARVRLEQDGNIYPTP